MTKTRFTRPHYIRISQVGTAEPGTANENQHQKLNSDGAKPVSHRLSFHLYAACCFAPLGTLSTIYSIIGASATASRCIDADRIYLAVFLCCAPHHNQLRRAAHMQPWHQTPLPGHTCAEQNGSRHVYHRPTLRSDSNLAQAAKNLSNNGLRDLRTKRFLAPQRAGNDTAKCSKPLRALRPLAAVASTQALPFLPASDSESEALAMAKTKTTKRPYS